jgi:hypothetical protein
MIIFVHCLLLRVIDYHGMSFFSLFSFLLYFFMFLDILLVHMLDVIDIYVILIYFIFIKKSCRYIDFFVREFRYELNEFSDLY